MTSFRVRSIGPNQNAGTTSLMANHWLGITANQQHTVMNKRVDIKIPDLRFEQSFMRSLQAYSGQKQPVEPTTVTGLSDAELELLSAEVDAKEQQEVDDSLGMGPIGQITPLIVIYAIIKDQIVMPLVQGFVWTGFLIVARPFLRQMVQWGLNSGTYVANLVGLNRLHQRRYTYS